MLPKKVAELPSEGMVRSTPANVIVGDEMDSELPIEITPVETLRLSNEKPSVRMEKFFTLIERSLSGLNFRSIEPSDMIVC